MNGIEKRAGDQDQSVTIGLRQSSAENDEDDEILICVVIECASERGYYQRPKARFPRGRDNRFLSISGGKSDWLFQHGDRSAFAHKSLR